MRPPVTRLIVAVAGAIGGAGAGLGYAATKDPLALLTVPAGIVLVGAALGAGVGLTVGLAERISHFLSPRPGAHGNAEVSIGIAQGSEGQIGQPRQRQV